MFKKRIACGLLVLVALCLATVYAPSQSGGTSGSGRRLTAPEPPSVAPQNLVQNAQPNLQELVTQLTEVRRKREALAKEEAALVAKIRAVVATQRADLNRVEQLLPEPGTGRVYDKDKRP